MQCLGRNSASPQYSPGASPVLGAFVAFACPLDMLTRLRRAASHGAGVIAVNLLSLQTLRTLLHFELYLRTFIQAAVTVGLDGRKMNEHIVTTGALDKSIALGSVKPLHYTFFFHYKLS